MRVMGNLEYAFIVNELQGIVGKHLSKFRQVAEDSFLLVIGDVSIIVQLGVRLHKTKYMLEESTQHGFSNKIKPYLDNGLLTAVSQHNQDRIVVFEFGSKLLIFEMFAKGNAILTEQGITIAAFHEENWTDRTIKKGEKYLFPKTNLKPDLKSALSDRFVISALLSLPLGKEYAKDALARCHIEEKKSGNALSQQEIVCLEKGIAAICASPCPQLFSRDGKPVDYGLTAFSQYVDSKEFTAFSEALDEYYWNAEKTELAPITKVRDRIEQQKNALEQLRQEEKMAKQAGDYIYANYGAIEEILKTAKKFKISELEKELKQYHPKINEKKKEIELEI